MKILVIHNFHRQGSSSGDDQVFENEVNILKENGIDVVTYSVKNDDFDNANILKKITLTFGMLWSLKNYKNVKNIIKKENPDIVHIHTFFPLLSPSVLYVSKKYCGKVVATLHDTRFICPCATSLRNNELCNKCGDGKYFRMIKYKCFKKSRLRSLYVAFVFKFHRIKKSFYKKIDKYICLNDSQIELLKEIGFDENKIVKKYNSTKDASLLIKDDIEVPKTLPNKYVVFYGRIGEEKGINILKEAWDNIDDIPLVIMGGGPLEDRLKNWNKNNVYYLGYTKHDLCLKIVYNSEFVVFPSIWYEGCSMVEVESLSLGKPIIATNLGFSTEAIIDNYNGMKFELGNVKQFIKHVNDLWNNHNKIKIMSQNARNEYNKNYTQYDNYDKLIKIYNDLMES